jgi:hypothetical protein
MRNEANSRRGRVGRGLGDGARGGLYKRSQCHGTAYRAKQSQFPVGRALREPNVRNEPNFASQDGAGGARGGPAGRTCKTNPIPADAGWNGAWGTGGVGGCANKTPATEVGASRNLR